ncbi:MAG: glycosyltransferase family 39 protein [Chloroflexota bacterium]
MRWRAGWFDLGACGLALAACLALRLAFYDSGPPLLNLDSEGYFAPAHDMLTGRLPEQGLRRTPGYPLFIALVSLATGEDLQRLVTAQHAVLGPLTVLLTYALGRLVAGRLVAAGAALLAAVSGPLLLYEHYVMTESFFTVLLLACLIAAIVAMRRGSVRWAFACGLLVGFAALTRPSMQLVLPLFGLAVVLGGGGLRARVTRVAVLAAGFALVVLPWMAFNQARYGAFVIAANGRFLLARTIKEDPGSFNFEAPAGVQEDAVKAAARRIAQQESERRPPGSTAQRIREELGLGEAEASRVMFDLALGAIAQRPAYFVTSSLGFLGEILVGRPIQVRREGLEWKEVDWDRRVRAVLQRPVYRADLERAQTLVSLYDPARLGALLPGLAALGVLAAVLGRAPRVQLLPAAVALALMGSSAALIGPEVRYRYPCDPIIGLLAIQAAALLIAIPVRARRRP